MKEVEVKAHLRDREKIVANLEKLGCTFGEKVKQIDTVYAKILGNVDEYLKNDHFVRIREKNDGRFIFTVKQPKDARKNLIKTEHETEVKNPKELENMLFLMGYKVANKVIKIRQVAKFKNYEICLDDVKDLGNFIEIEKMYEDGTESDEEALGELKAFIGSLGVLDSDEVKKGYDIMMIEHLEKK